MFELLVKYGLSFSVTYAEHLWTFTVSGSDANGEPQTEIYAVNADGEDAARAEATRAVEKYVKLCEPKEL